MKQQNPNQITWRSIILGILLSLPHGFFSIQTPTPTTVSLIYTVVLTILLLVLVNILIKQQAPKIAFSQAELLTIYTMLSLSVAISGHDVLQVLAPIIGHAFWFASPEKNTYTTLMEKTVVVVLVMLNFRVKKIQLRFWWATHTKLLANSSDL